MCGIAGIALRQAAASADTVRTQIARLDHRGPDDTGFFQAGPVALGHARLSIIDPAGGHQPLVSDDGRLAVVANGEIYNHVELRQTLEARGFRFQTGSDSEAILHAYRAYGEAFLEHLEGMFAFALFDRERERLLLARDRLGIKPLFLAAADGGLAFASETKALLPTLPHRPEVHPPALVQFIQNQFSTGRETPLQGVERVLPGEAVAIEGGRIRRRWIYWSPQRAEPRAGLTFDQAAAEFDDLMDTVMRQHMRTDVPFGLFLSGGVDSGLLLALLARYRSEPIRTFSVGFDSDRFRDELPIAEQLAERFGARHTSLRLPPETLLNREPHAVWSADELMRDYANLPTNCLAEEAGKSLKVVFTGEGGDEAFAGYGRYHASTLERWFKGLVHPGTGGFRTRGMLRRRQPHWLFGERLLGELDAARRPFIQAWQASPDQWTDLQRMQYTDLTTALPDNLLVKADRMLMAWGVEGRVPLCDRRVVEFGLGLPNGLKVDGRCGKVFLKRWAERFLPKEQIWAPKQGFRVPVREWLAGPFLDRLEPALLRDPALGEWFQREGIRRLCQRQRRKGDASRPLWALMEFALWHRMLLDGQGQAPAANTDPVELLQ